MNDRVNPFSDLKDFSVEKNKKEKNISNENVEQVASDNNFVSRINHKKEAKDSKLQRRYTTGRNQQINIKATSTTIEKLYKIADEENIPLGEVLSRAIDSYRREKSK
jgi:hypothetical protein